MKFMKIAFSAFFMGVLVNIKLANGQGCDDLFDKSPQCEDLVKDNGLAFCETKFGDQTLSEICLKSCNADCAPATEETVRAENRARLTEEQRFNEARRQEQSCDDLFDKSPQCADLVKDKGLAYCETKFGDQTLGEICLKSCNADCAPATEEAGRAEKRARLTSEAGEKRARLRAQQWFLEARRQEQTECKDMDSQCAKYYAGGADVCEQVIYGSGDPPKKFKDYCEKTCEVCT